MGRGEPQTRCLDPGRRKSRQRGEQTFCTASERHPLNSDSCVVKLPGTGQFSQKGGARKAKGMGGATKRGKRLIPDLFFWFVDDLLLGLSLTLILDNYKASRLEPLAPPSDTPSSPCWPPMAT